MRIFRLKNTIVCLVAVSALALAPACSDDSESSSDTGTPKQDGGTQPDTGTVQPPEKVECDNDCQEYVADDVIVPLSSEDAQKYGFKQGAQTLNKLGDILTAVASNMPMQESVTGAINAGDLLLLMRLKADDFTNDPGAVGQIWQAQTTSCCATPEDPTACASEAAQSCFSGTYEFTADPTRTGTFAGGISGGAMNMGTPSYTLTLPVGEGVLVSINVVNVQIRGTVTAQGITDGVIAGAMSQDEVEGNVLESIVTLINDGITNDLFEPGTEELLLSMLDGDGDEVITKDEVLAVVGVLLAPDLDLDGDGTKEHLSMGIGFSAVPAQITVP